MDIYEIKVRNRKGEKISLSEYRNKVLLIVNTATGCGFTPQYKGLEKLYKKYHDKGLEILDFPCNQFLKQAPGTDDEIHRFCIVKYDTSFDQFSKIEVNGNYASSLYVYLKEQQPKDESDGFIGKVVMRLLKMISSSCKEPQDIRWNFTKFLVDRHGNVVGRYPPSCKPEKLELKIRELLHITGDISNENEEDEEDIEKQKSRRKSKLHYTNDDDDDI